MSNVFLIYRVFFIVKKTTKKSRLAGASQASCKSVARRIVLQRECIKLEGKASETVTRNFM